MCYPPHNTNNSKWLYILWKAWRNNRDFPEMEGNVKPMWKVRPRYLLLICSSDTISCLCKSAFHSLQLSGQDWQLSGQPKSKINKYKNGLLRAADSRLQILHFNSFTEMYLCKGQQWKFCTTRRQDKVRISDELYNIVIQPLCPCLYRKRGWCWTKLTIRIPWVIKAEVYLEYNLL